MLSNIKKLIKENKKTFIGFLIMISSILIMFAYLFSRNQAEKKVIVQALKENIIVKTITKATSMEKYATYMKEKDSSDVLMLLFVLLFFIGIFIIISSKEKK